MGRSEVVRDLVQPSVLGFGLEGRCGVVVCVMLGARSARKRKEGATAASGYVVQIVETGVGIDIAAGSEAERTIRGRECVRTQRE